MALSWFELSQLSMQRPKLLVRGRRRHLLWSAGGTTIHWVPLQHVLCLLTSQTLKGAAWAQSSLSACCQALCCSQHLCFTPCLHACVALSSANRILKGGRPLKSCCVALQADCLHAPSAHLSSCRSILRNVLTCLRGLKASVGSICASNVLAGLPLQSMCNSALLGLGIWY